MSHTATKAVQSATQPCRATHSNTQSHIPTHNQTYLHTATHSYRATQTENQPHRATHSRARLQGSFEMHVVVPAFKGMRFEETRMGAFSGSTGRLVQ